MSVYGPGGDSPGTNLNRLMDSLGFAEQLGDVYGASLDAAIGNNHRRCKKPLGCIFAVFKNQSTRSHDGWRISSAWILSQTES